RDAKRRRLSRAEVDTITDHVGLAPAAKILDPGSLMIAHAQPGAPGIVHVLPVTRRERPALDSLDDGLLPARHVLAGVSRREARDARVGRLGPAAARGLAARDVVAGTLQR